MGDTKDKKTMIKINATETYSFCLVFLFNVLFVVKTWHLHYTAQLYFIICLYEFEWDHNGYHCLEL